MSEKLEDIIEAVRSDDGSKPKASVKRLKVVLKVFANYSTNSETLPPTTLIPVCLFSVPDLLRKIMGLEEDDFLVEKPVNAGVRVCVQSFLKGLLKLLLECEEQIKHVVVQSMAKSAWLVVGFELLYKKWFKELVRMWATSADNLNLSLRCFVAFEKMIRFGSEELYMWGLRRLYVGFFEHCGQVNWRNLEHINFMVNCFCQIVKVYPERAYYVLFGYVRTIAVQIQSLNSKKSRQKIELSAKLYSQQMLQILRLLVHAVGKSGQELSALIYPLAELLNAYQHISESPQYIPLKLHVIKMELELMQMTSIYLPHALQTIVKILGSSPFQKKHAKKAQAEGSIELGYKLSLGELKNTNVINDIFNKTIFYIYWLAETSSLSIAGPEISRKITKETTELQFAFKGYRKQVRELAKILKEDIETIELARRKKKLTLTGEESLKFERQLKKMSLKARQKYQDLLEEHLSLLKAKVMAEHDDNGEEAPNQEEPEEDDDELESGWEQASEGASEFEEPEKQDLQAHDQEEISYEGDPSNASQAARQWSEHEWSSQAEIDEE